MTVKSGTLWSGLVVCLDATGAKLAPTVGPVGQLHVDGIANGAAVTVTGANPYKWIVNLPALTVAQCVSMYVTATINAIATASVVAEDVADDPWAAPVRTLTSSAAATAATVAGSSITGTRGDTWSISLTGLGNIAARTKLWFTVKAHEWDTDAQSVLQVEETGGLLVLNGAATTTTNATLVVDDAALGNITLTVKPAASAVVPATGYIYDMQQLTAAGAVQTLTQGAFTVSSDTTRAIT